MNRCLEQRFWIVLVVKDGTLPAGWDGDSLLRGSGRYFHSRIQGPEQSHAHRMRFHVIKQEHGKHQAADTSLFAVWMKRNAPQLF
ncbi:hypothetical protein BCY86_02505 [Pajaroellobacter abortibovis]|uniref:Uncharacterized protein n=1 Tax=Pajaroellobacter abortibovis TaxID=1882918 RepID=A0A1L6MVU7_9BACT|nr:hypothetical protein BCY86_02505 [Pajaroellobacter abortibovis]